MSKILDTSINGHMAAGIVITEEQANDLAMLNCMINADKNNGNASDPVFYTMLLLRLLNILPDSMNCEATDRFGRFVNSETLEP